MNIEKSSIKKWIAVMDSVKQGSKNAGLSKKVIKIASKPRRVRIAISLKKLSDNAKASENIIVPGKVLSDGMPDKKFSVSAIEYSEAALRKLKDAGCSVVPVEEMIKREGVRVII